MRGILFSVLFLFVAPLAAQSSGQFDPSPPTQRRLDWRLLDPVATYEGPWNKGIAVAAIQPVFRCAEPAVALPAYMLAPARSFPNVSRHSLEGMGETLQPYPDVPGGVVLGLTAEVPEGWGLPRVESLGGSHWKLTLGDGSWYTLPAIEPAALQDAVSFVANPRRSDSVIDIVGERVAWLAPEFQSEPIRRMLERADRAPRKSIAGAGPYKTVIVDRAIRVAPRTDEALALEADLEVRLYAARDSCYILNAIHRAASYPLILGPGGLQAPIHLPPGSIPELLVAPLGDLSELAGWVGFLRWVQRENPLAFEELLAAGKLRFTESR